MSGLYMIVLFIVFYTVVIVGLNALVYCVDDGFDQADSGECGQAV